MKIFGYSIGAKAEPQADNGLGDVSINDASDNSLFKAYVPEFLYKPPFGYPRKENLPLIRQLAKNPYVFSVVKTLTDEAASNNYDIKYKEGVEPSSSMDAKRDEMLKFFHNPNKNKESFKQILRAVVKDIAEVDSGIMVKVFNLKGEFTQLFARDGASFLKNPDIYGYIGDRSEYVKPTNINYALTPEHKDYPNVLHQYQLAYKDSAAYFQYGTTAMALPVPFGRREIIYIMQNPRSDSIYGLSPIQILADVITTLVYGANYNLDFYMNNNMPEGVISILGANQPQIKAFRERFDSQFRQKDKITGFMRKVGFKFPIVNQPVEFKPFQLDPKIMQIIEQQSWFTKLVWACYDEETEILTDDGFKLFKDLKDEKVARINPDDLAMDFVKPIDKQTYNYDGEMICYKTKSLDLKVTPEHKMLSCTKHNFFEGKTKWESVEARNLSKGIIPQAGNFLGEKIDELSFKDLTISGEDFCSFMGIWLSDGWVELSNNRICLCASDVYPENKEFIEQLLTNMGIDYKIKVSKANDIVNGRKVNTNGDMNYYRFSNSEFHDYLLQFGKAKVKFIPKIILNTVEKQRNLFLDSFMLGDGCVGHKGKNSRFTSMSKSLIDGLQELIIKNGISATVFQNSCNHSWELTIRKSKSKTIDKKFYSRIIEESVSKEHYKGKVYDVTVPEHHFLVVRRNGRVSISGNCYGVNADEMGFTEDSNRATGEGQSAAYKRKAVKPMLELLKYHIENELFPEWGEEVYDSFDWAWDDYDLEVDIKKHQLFQSQINMGIKTAEMIAAEEGINVEELKAHKEAEREQRMEEDQNKGFQLPIEDGLKALEIIKGTRVKVVGNSRAHAGKTGVVENIRTNGEEPVYMIRFVDGMDVFFYQELKVVDGGVAVVPEPEEEPLPEESEGTGLKAENNLETELVGIIKTRGKELIKAIDQYKKGNLDRL